MTLSEETRNGEPIIFPRKFANYEVTGTIGRSSCGVVVSVVDVMTKRRFAAKIVPISAKSSSFHLQENCHLSCPQLIRYEEVICMDEMVYLIMEEFDGPSLYELTLNRPTIVAHMWKKIALQIALGLSHLHKKGLVHGNLKPENVFVDPDFNCKLADFGSLNEVKEMNAARKKKEDSPRKARLEKAEPVIMSVSEKKAADMRAFGVTVYSAVTREFPWRCDCGELNVSKLSPELVVLLSRCCDPNPKERAKIRTVLEMPFAQPGGMTRPRMVKTMSITRPAVAGRTLSKAGNARSLVHRRVFAGPGNIAKIGAVSGR